ncbi:hypothetical protein [Coxiella burnetii]|uniref:Uncharacterized protein n=1 Tax=Coxiella burnetii (strain RSA 493 / Nine Mile phase I) TaxID=227377 RepID=B5QSA7_COXBU|nr:hypothetical protein [Coxiella burnetii]YP_002332980.1 hypothetical protein CBU_1045a [Coxiella burnetii RSA 493]ABX78094.1 hypothetical protein COXBURSA331_A0893 [Coxiella burnetii RSA 331]ACI15271.1 hypothetical protein CBU_1045a [Coxiella burnetii RSA 493]ACJ18325.1 hypothetical protein CbuG_0958 [Coxiella burnetii CbuG_Q212]ACJ20042.1 hypothetical protein CbuK_0792 [Coxiella burnetii CbuK_Q154]AML49324.1 hypothetical protein AUR58_09205 [Coxiella burnetii]
MHLTIFMIKILNNKLKILFREKIGRSISESIKERGAR